VSTEEERLGILTQATSAPVLLVYFSISWLSLVTPSELANKISLPLLWAWLAKSLSEVRLIKTGKAVKLA
jgi:hypothetical protein